MLRLLKALVTAVVVAVVAVCAVGWIGLEAAVRRAAAATAKPWSGRLVYERVSTRLLPPAAVLEDAVLRNAEGDELLRAKRIVLPLLPGAWTGNGSATASPRLERFTLTLDVPRGDAPSWAEAADDKGLPKPHWWSGSGGTILVRSGERTLLRLDGVRVKRRKYSLTIEGRVAGVPGSRATLAGEWDPSGKAPVSFALEVGPFDAAAGSEWILPATEGRVRGGHARLRGTVTFPRDALAFDGTLAVSELLVEGRDASPGAVEAAIRRGNGAATFPLAVEGSIGMGTDWEGRVRAAVQDAASSGRVAATRF